LLLISAGYYSGLLLEAVMAASDVVIAVVIAITAVAVAV
tara:strand:- start:209 stop:325 length:117 start_codon:yes stop_codon:yes gene_type:complete